MDFLGTVILIVVIVVVLIAIVALVVFLKIKRATKGAFGTSNISDVIKAGEYEAQNAVKSVNGMESLMRPRIERDFPSMSVDDLKSRDRDEIFAYFDALDTGDCTHFEANSNLNDEIALAVQEATGVGISGVKIHKHAISGYKKTKKTATVQMQAAVEYKKGSDANATQSRVNTQWIYVLDDSNYTQEGMATLNCPNCAAPLRGKSVCEHCSSMVETDYTRVWQLNAIKEA